MAEIAPSSVSEASFQGKTSLFYQSQNWTFAVTKKNNVKYFKYDSPKSDPDIRYIQTRDRPNAPLRRIDAGRGHITVSILTGPDKKGLRLYLVNKDDYLEEYCWDEGGSEWYSGELTDKQYEVAKISDISATPEPIKVVYQGTGKPEYLSMAWRDGNSWTAQALTNFQIDE